MESHGARKERGDPLGRAAPRPLTTQRSATRFVGALRPRMAGGDNDGALFPSFQSRGSQQTGGGERKCLEHLAAGAIVNGRASFAGLSLLARFWRDSDDGALAPSPSEEEDPEGATIDLLASGLERRMAMGRTP